MSAPAPRPRVAVVGHVEWLDVAVVPHMPAAGEIVTAGEHFETAGGGGAVAAVQLRKLAGAALFLTALGDDGRGALAAAVLRDEHGVELHAAVRRRPQRRAFTHVDAQAERTLAAAVLRDEHGVELHAAVRRRPQRRAFTHVDAQAERTITVLGDRLVPHGADPLPWGRLREVDAVYLTGGDGAAARAARAARVLVATARAADALLAAGDVAPDVLVASARDEKERAGLDALPRPRWTVLTDGARGGRWEGADGSGGTWDAAPLPGSPLDAYGCGDSFAAGLAYGLSAGMELPDALALGARCGAACLTGRGPYQGQLTSAG